MNSLFQKWYRKAASIEEAFNKLAKTHKMGPVEFHGWKNRLLEERLHPLNLMIKCKQKNSLLSFDCNDSFKMVTADILDKHGSDAQWLVRNVAFLQMFRKHGIHELSIPYSHAQGLINTSLNLDVDQFTSMFPTMVVSFPNEMHQEFADMGIDMPLGTIFHHNPDSHLLTVQHLYRTDEISFTSFFSKQFSGNETMEHSLQKNIQRDWIDPAEGGLSDSRKKSITMASRLVINVVLLAQMQNAMMPATDSELDPRRDKVRRFARLVSETLPKGKKMPKTTYWTFQPKLKTYNESSTLKSGEGTGASVKPHWREGHWRRVAIGVGRVDRKWVHIPAVFVNYEKFAGSMGDTYTHHSLNHDFPKKS